ncbi:MAG: restriction endonuclease subunit S [Verrucomicrobia bacterium]|nr:restriction endonuclease subunit S [Verrucomicrobiota bacterium]
MKRSYAIQLGKMLQNRPEGPADTEVPYLKAQHVQWFSVRTSPVPKMWASPRDMKQFGIATGDLLVCEGGEGGRAGIVHAAPPGLIIQNALHRVRPHGRCLNEFLQYVMSAVSATGWFDAINNKATIAHFTREKFGALGMPVAPLPEQTAIVRFLDYMDRRIRRYIRAKQKLIKLLEEQKQAIIHRAVTRGLDPNVRLKPSGVEWLGDVPEQWEVRRLKTLCSMRSGDGITSMSIEPEGDYPVYGGNGVRGYTSRYTHDGEFALIGRQGALCGNVHLARGRFWASEHAVVASLRPGHVLNWFGAILIVMDLNQYSIAAAQPGLAVERIMNLWLPVPPIAEQEDIAEHIHRETAGIVAVAERTQSEIALLREYRTRLIADVVTGKLDVREAAARLPEETDAAEPPDEVEDDAEEAAEEDATESEETEA